MVKIRSKLSEIDPMPPLILKNMKEIRARERFLKEQYRLLWEQMGQRYMGDR